MALTEPEIKFNTISNWTVKMDRRGGYHASKFDAIVPAL
jgi:hypothetical protein